LHLDRSTATWAVGAIVSRWFSVSKRRASLFRRSEKRAFAKSKFLFGY
jgi:hypothetical protein